MPLLAAVALFCPCASQAQTAADSSVTLLWTASGDDGNVGTATSYQIRYRTVGIAATDTASWWGSATNVPGVPVPHPAGTTDSMVVRGLTPLTTYYFLIRVADEVPNWSGYSNLAVRTTSGADVTAPRAITDLAVTGTTGTSMSLRWTAPGDDGGTGTATSYDIRYSTSAITAANWGSAVTVTGGGHAADLHGHRLESEPHVLRRDPCYRRGFESRGALERPERNHAGHHPARSGPRPVARSRFRHGRSDRVVGRIRGGEQCALTGGIAET